ncbi:CBU_0592 family membrane protein [Thalassotalea nanhaiensis]
MDKIVPKGLNYNLSNLVGAILLFTSLCINFNLASFVIDIFWVIAAIVSLINYKRRKIKPT